MNLSSLASFLARGSMATVLCFMLSSGEQAHGDLVVFDNGVGGASGVDDASSSDLDITSFTADDFVLGSDATVTGVRWTGVYALDDTPPATDDFTIEFYNDDGGSPGTLHSSINVGNAVNRVDSGHDLLGLFDIYEFTASIPGSSFTSGQTYWLSIFADTDTEGDDFFWGIRGGAGNSQQRGAGAWSAGGHQADFQLSAVPEPGFALLGSLAIVGLVSSRRRR